MAYGASGSLARGAEWQMGSLSMDVHGCNAVSKPVNGFPEFQLRSIEACQRISRFLTQYRVSRAEQTPQNKKASSGLVQDGAPGRGHLVH